MLAQEYNRAAWDRLVEQRDRWTVPVTSEEIERARQGDLQLLLTPSKPVPSRWLPPLKGMRVLCLASGGGQQGPLLAAAGAHVTVFDNSARQLDQDRHVASREGLELELVQGDMADLSCFPERRFDLVFHPCSNCFSQVVRPVWNECFQVLRGGGYLLAGLTNPVMFQFDPHEEKDGRFVLRYAQPVTPESIGLEEFSRHYGDEPWHFGHTLEDLLGGQLDAGFHIVGMFEDDWGGSEPIDRLMRGYIATRALKIA